MTPEKLLDALTDIDSAAIRDARTIAPGIHRNRRRIAVLLAAVIALVAMTVTAFAAEEITGWIRDFFTGKGENNLTQAQLDYIDDNEQVITEPLEHNGYSIEVKSFISSADTTYVTLGVTAPENVNLSQIADPLLQLDTRVTAEYGRNPSSAITRRVDDFDGLDNTTNFVLIIQAHPKYTVPEWYIHINAINTVYHDANQTHYYPILADGPWDFTISLENSDTQTVELITEPVETLAAIPDLDNHSFFFKELTISSFILGPLDAKIFYNDEETTIPILEGIIPWSAIEFKLYAVMEDGSIVSFTTGHSHPGECRLLADTPIILDEVEYIQLADGNKLMMP